MANRDSIKKAREDFSREMKKVWDISRTALTMAVFCAISSLASWGVIFWAWYEVVVGW